MDVEASAPAEPGCAHPDGFAYSAESGDDRMCIHCGAIEDAAAQPELIR